MNAAMSARSATAELDRAEIIAHLGEVLADRRFASAERNAKFLRYVVEAALDGKAGELKETVIASDVYGRSSGYDPKADSIVRVEASRLRQKLRSFYEEDGRNCRIRIQLPSGAYVPAFERIGDSAESQPPPVNRSLFFRFWPLIASAGFTAVLLGSYGARLPKASAERVSEALAAWQEGVALLDLDPHAGEAANGAPRTLLRAIERLEFSTVLNPYRAQSWATLAEAYDYAAGYKGRDPVEDERRASAAAARAIELDAGLAAGRHMQGLLLKNMRWDFPRAEASYKEALRLDPRNGYAAVEYVDLLWQTGRIARAVEELRRARALLPAFPALAVKEAELHHFLGRPDAALAAAQSALELRSTYWRAHVLVGMAYESKSDDEKALARYRQVLQSNPNDRRALPAYGYLLAKTGRTQQARDIAARLEELNSTVRNCAFQIAVVYAGLGEDDTALHWLETAYRTRQAHFPFAAVEPRFRRFHQNHRFLELLGRTKQVPVAW